MNPGFCRITTKEGLVMLEVGLLTLKNVGILLIFMLLGYILYHSGKFPVEAPKVISTLTTTLFLPAYTISSLAQNFTPDKIGQQAALLGYGVIFIFAAIGLGLLLSKLLGKDPYDRHSLAYAFTFPNYGYFGYPVIAGVFGAQTLSDVMIFTIPTAIACQTYGYILFSPEKKINWKKVFMTPSILAVFIGSAIGLSGIRLPAFCIDVLDTAGGCMSPASMLLGGFLLGKFPIKSLLSSFRAYLLSAIRMLGIPLVFGLVLYFLGLREQYFLFPLLIVTLPLGLNLVVFPESYGLEEVATGNARICFVSYLLALILLPLSFALITYLA